MKKKMPETENATEPVRRGRGRPRGAGRPRKVPREWKNTRAALEKLDNLLKCKLCSSQLKEPHFVGSCEHTFCKSCVEKYSGKHCPECNVPVLARELQRDITVTNVVNYSNQLKIIINEEESSSTTKDNYESESEGSASPLSPRKKGRESHDDIKHEKKSNNAKVVDNASLSPTSTRSKRRTGLRTTHTSPKPSDTSDQPKTNTLRFKRNIKGETPLHLAAIKGDVVTIRRLLHQGANPNEKDNAGWTPLHEACHHGHKIIAEILLDGGALIDIPACDNETPLHDAVSMGKIDIVTLLVTRGANIHARNSAGITPLDMARTDELIEALNTPVNPPSSGQSTNSTSLIPKIDDIVLLKTGLNQEQEMELLSCADVLNAVVVEKFNDEVTHLICVCDENGHCQRTMKFLQAILAGKWILSYDWVENCLDFKRRVFEEPFEVIGNKNQLSTYGPKRSRLNAVQQFPPLFDGCSFYLHGNFQFPSPNRDNLTTLIKLGGGTVLSREPRSATATTAINTVPYHAIKDENGDICPANQFIVYQDIIPPRFKSNCDKYIRCVKFGWLLDCITSYQLLPPN